MQQPFSAEVRLLLLLNMFISRRKYSHVQSRRELAVAAGRSAGQPAS